MERTGSPLKIAVVGAGISGITAAYLLQKKHRVKLLEKNDYFGGHTCTATVPTGPDAGTPVDMGFIVLNAKTYPHFIRFLQLHGVQTAPTDMSLSYFETQTGFAYATRNLNAFFAQRRNLFDPGYWRFLFEIKTFLQQTQRDYHADRLGGQTLGEYLEKNGFSDALIHRFIVPWSAAIWSAADREMLGFPMQAFAQFYENHGLLSLKKEVPWFYVKGGSQSYVRAFLDTFPGIAVHSAPVARIRRDSSVTVVFENGEAETFDKVVIATHADEALALLEAPTDAEKRLLGAWRYSPNHVVLHTDTRWMPDNRRAWASWNYIRPPGNRGAAPITVTYYMNRLQNLSARRAYLVTLNPPEEIAREHVITETRFTHPIYSFAAFDSQKALARLNGDRHTYYCGSYFGYGFHEDGVRSAVAVGNHFGVNL